jgi:hypothetical protein
MNTANNQSKQQINTAALRGTREAHQPDEFLTLISQTSTAARRLKQFISPAELKTIGNACKGAEGEFFMAKLIELAELVGSMPTTYQTDGMGDSAIAYLHYFTPAADFYITERDHQRDQQQAFGLSIIWEEELGYISISELINVGAELDLYWTPKSLGQVKAERQMADVNSVCHPMHY